MMENTIQPEEYLTPPGEGPEEASGFAIQKEKSYTDEVIDVQYDQLTMGLRDLLIKAEQNLQRMAGESARFRSKLNELLPKKRSFWFFDVTSWKPSYEHQLIYESIAGFGIELYPGYKLCIKRNYLCSDIAELLDPNYSQVKIQIEKILQILSDPKETIKYFIANLRLRIR